MKEKKANYLQLYATLLHRGHISVSPKALLCAEFRYYSGYRNRLENSYFVVLAEVYVPVCRAGRSQVSPRIYWLKSTPYNRKLNVSQCFMLLTYQPDSFIFCKF